MPLTSEPVKAQLSQKMASLLLSDITQSGMRNSCMFLVALVAQVLFGVCPLKPTYR